MTHVVCVGQIMLDVVARLPGPLAPGSDTPAPITVHGGGAAANVATWIARTGAEATLVAMVGDDDLGRRAVAELAGAGVQLAVAVDPRRPTGTCIVLVDPDGERTMIPHAGANSGLDAVDPATALPGAADALYVSGYALLDPGSRAFALGALRVARERGWTVAVDAASAAPLAGADDFADWVGTGALLFANDDEARVLTGRTGADAARVLARRVGQAVVKSGAAGAVWSDSDAMIAITPDPVEVVDSTGAGDAFAAGYLATNGTVAQRLRVGAALAARAVGTSGARPKSDAELLPDASRGAGGRTGA